MSSNRSKSYMRSTTGYNSGDWGDTNKGWDDGPETVVVENHGGMSDEQAARMDDAIAKGAAFIILLALFILSLPFLLGMVLSGAVAYSLFRFLHYRPKFIAMFSGVFSVIMLIVFMMNGAFAKIGSGYASIITGIKQHVGVLDAVHTGLSSTFVPLFILGLLAGVWVGLCCVVWQTRRMKNAPWLVESDSLATNKWMHGFTYRTSPFEKAKKDRIIAGIKADTYHPYRRSDLTPLGIEEEPLMKSPDPAKNKSYQVVCRADDEVPKHTMVTGAAGSGKTVTLKSLMTRDIENGKTIFVIDCKKDPEVAEFLAHQASEHNASFYHYSADYPYKIQGNIAGPSSYDPIAGLSPDKRTDMMLSIREWDSSASIYRDNARTYLHTVFAALEEAERTGVINDVKALDTTQGEMWTFAQLLDKNIFNTLAIKLNAVNTSQAQYIRQQVSRLNENLSMARARTQDGQNTQRAHAEYQSKISGMMISSYGKWMKGGDGSGSGKIINISKLASEGRNVVLFSLDASTKDDIGSIIGSIICTDLTNMTETRKNLGQENPVSIYIDEFQSLPPECVKSMLQKARSAGVGLTLAFQSLEQVNATTGSDSYTKALLDTCSNFIFHSGSNYDTGLMAAKIIGEHDVTKYIVQRRNETKLGAFNWLNNRDLQVSQHIEKEWIMDPSAPQSLAMPNAQNGYLSEAIIIKKASSDPIDKGRIGAIAHKVKMIAPDCVLHEWFDVNAPAIDIDAPMDIRVKSRALMQDINNAIMQHQANSQEPVMADDEPTMDRGPAEHMPAIGHQGVTAPEHRGEDKRGPLYTPHPGIMHDQVPSIIGEPDDEASMPDIGVPGPTSARLQRVRNQGGPDRTVSAGDNEPRQRRVNGLPVSKPSRRQVSADSGSTAKARRMERINRAYHMDNHPSMDIDGIDAEPRSTRDDTISIIDDRQEVPREPEHRGTGAAYDTGSMPPSARVGTRQGPSPAHHNRRNNGGLTLDDI